MHALRHIDEGAAGPCGGVERGELVVIAGDAFAEVLLDDLGVFAHRGVGVDENHPLLLEILLNRVVDHFGFVLRGHAGNQTLLFRFGNAELVVGGTNLVRQFLPRGCLLVDRLDIVLEVIRVEILQVYAPLRHRLGYEVPIPLQTLFKHPLRFALIGTDGAHDALVDALLRRLACGIGVMPPIGVVAELADDLVILLDLILVDAGAIGHVLAHLHVSRGVWCL